MARSAVLARPAVAATDRRAVAWRWVLVAIALGYSVDQVGLTPVSAVLPTMAREFDVGLETASLVMAGYLLLLSGLLLPAGRLGDLVGHTRVFRAGLVVATLGAVLGSLAQSVWLLIAARALQGTGAAMILGCSLAIITASFPLSWRGRAIGIVVTSSMAIPIISIALGTFFADTVNWRVLFLLVLPLGIAALFTSRPLRDDALPERRPFDVLGSGLLFLAIVALSLSLSHLHGGEATFAADWQYHTLLQVVALACFGLFVLAERRAAAPLVDVRHFRHRVFSAAVVVNGLLHMTMMSAVFLSPFYVRRVLDLPLVSGGVLLIAMFSTTTAMSWVSGLLHDLVGTRWLRPLAMALVAIGLAALGLWSQTLSYASLIAVSVVAAAGSGLLMTANNTVIVSAVPTDLRGFATGMLETGRQLGHSFGVTISTSALGLGVGGVATALADRAQLATGFQWAWLIMAGLSLFGVVAALRGGRGNPQP